MITRTRWMHSGWQIDVTMLEYSSSSSHLGFSESLGTRGNYFDAVWRSPCPRGAAYLAGLRPSCASERPTSARSPAASRAGSMAVSVRWPQ